MLDAGELESAGRLLRCTTHFWWMQGLMLDARPTPPPLAHAAPEVASQDQGWLEGILAGAQVR